MPGRGDEERYSIGHDEWANEPWATTSWEERVYLKKEVSREKYIN